MLRRVAPLAKSKGAQPEPGTEAFKPDPSVSAFAPGGRNSRDMGGLSTKRQAEDPEVAYWTYLKTAPGKRLALGTWGFRVQQADDLNLPSFDDGGIDDEHPENHATVWFPMPKDVSNARLKREHDRLAEDLRSCALQHGCLFRPIDPFADARSLESTPV